MHRRKLHNAALAASQADFEIVSKLVIATLCHVRYADFEAALDERNPSKYRYLCNITYY